MRGPLLGVAMPCRLRILPIVYLAEITPEILLARRERLGGLLNYYQRQAA